MSGSYTVLQAPFLVQELVYAVDEGNLEAFLQADSTLCTPKLTECFEFIAKYVWISKKAPYTVVVINYWKDGIDAAVSPQLPVEALGKGCRFVEERNLRNQRTVYSQFMKRTEKESQFDFFTTHSFSALPAVEELIFQVDPDHLETFLDWDHRVWTLKEAQHSPYFIGKDVWISETKPGEVTSLIYWKNRAGWYEIGNEFLETLQTEFDAAVGVQNYTFVRAVHEEIELDLFSAYQK